MAVNDNAQILDKPGALKSFAGKPASKLSIASRLLVQPFDLLNGQSLLY
jgi:hypothetical protein